MSLSVDAPPTSAIGLAYEVRGKLGVTRKQGIALAVEGNELLLHLSPKDKQPTRVPADTPPTAAVRQDLCPAARLIMAADLPDAKLGWDRDLLRTTSSELCADRQMLRAVFDDAVALGWQGIVDWAPLTATEKAWRAAHHAATTGDEQGLLMALSQLPKEGYPARAQLLLPHLGLLARNPHAWRPVVRALVEAGVFQAEEVAATLEDWEAALGGGTALLPASQQADWTVVRERLAKGDGIPAALASSTPAWQATSLITSSKEPLDGHMRELAGLEPALLDDLVDAGRLTVRTTLDDAPGAVRAYLCARLDPARLSEHELRVAGHDGELARRYFLAGDRSSLSSLDRSPRPLHYQALLDVIEGARPDPERLDSATMAKLGLPMELLDRIKDGVASTLTPEIAADPSLWPVFADVATEGRLLANATRAPNDPSNVWIAMRRLVGLIWQDKLQEAVQHGRALLPHVSEVERQEDEVLSLTAFVLFQLGQESEALGMLEHALQGEYTENLLVNASIVASNVQSEIGVRYLARIVEEAPTPELQKAGLNQAISVWNSTDLEFPKVLIPALSTVLATRQSVEDYVQLGVTAVNVAPEVVLAMPDLGGELTGPHIILSARAKLKVREDFYLSDLAAAFTKVYRAEGRPEWFNKQWGSLVEFVQESVFVDFGEAMGSAELIDHVLVNAPELFTQETRFVLAPQAGAHLAENYSKKGGWLNEAAMAKFFFNPINEYLSIRHTLPEGLADYLGNNFASTLSITGVNLIGCGRDVIAQQYNPLVERLRYDGQNRFAILSQMERVLSDALSGPMATLDRIVETLRRVGPKDPKRQDFVQTVANDTDEWRREIYRLRQDL